MTKKKRKGKKDALRKNKLIKIPDEHITKSRWKHHLTSCRIQGRRPYKNNLMAERGGGSMGD